MFSSKYNKESENPKRLNAEGRFTKTQIISNNTNRILAYNNLDIGYSMVFRKQQLGACSCRKEVSIKDGKLFGGFTCRKRWCTSCNKYRSLKLFQAYAPAIYKIHKDHLANKKENAGLWLVTLTKPTVTWGGLPNTLKEINKRWRLLYKLAKKKKLKNFNGIRKLECSANPIKGLNKRDVKDRKDFTYHAHIHVLIQGRGNAIFLRKEWLGRWDEAEVQCQDIRKFNGRIAEMLKYTAKSVHGNDNIPSSSYAKAIMWIYNCLQKKRVFFTYGNIKKAGEEEYKAWEEEQRDNTKDVLDELTDEERQEIRKDKTWAEGKEFIYKKEVHNYVSEEGLRLVDKKDLDLDNPAHFSQKKIKAIRKFDGSTEGKIQEQEIDKKREELLGRSIDKIE